LVDSVQPGLEGYAGNGGGGNQSGRIETIEERPITTASGNGFWNNFDLAFSIDGKTRRIEPGTFPLAHGVPARVGKLRAYGNAICVPTAVEFIKAFMEIRDASTT
jgi:DNA (cytosine-5)-methyltransferase 1